VLLSPVVTRCGFMEPEKVMQFKLVAIIDAGVVRLVWLIARKTFFKAGSCTQEDPRTMEMNFVPHRYFRP